ncbi:ankyrin repeat-containing domain protein [Mycena rosella]|uniref:Ankyrin repeat-containing domain protein n=1 Tax=Mycena rosella TaxID=1033263 RepID=A0AAD7DTY6_MYCRO|nr:ankyrin repeat-containing domain protein [Mycena rosella]
MDPITAATTVITLGTFVKDLVELSLKIKDSIEKVGENKTRLRNLTTDVLDTVSELGNLMRGHRDQVPSHALATALRNLTQQMERIREGCQRIALAQRTSGIPGLTELKSWLNRDKIEAEIDRLKEHRNECYAQFTLFSTARTEWTTLQIVDMSARKEDDVQRINIIEWLSPINFFQRQADIFRTLQAGTGQWLLADTQFKNWACGSGQMLWCHGMPGAGKTVLASLVVNHLKAQVQNSDIAVGYIYLNHKETETQTLSNLLGSLWKQLILGNPLPSKVHDLYKHHCERHTRPSLDEFREIVDSAVAQYSKVYLVVDALDEYPEDLRLLLLEYLSTMGSTVNLLVTSRPHISIDFFFPNTKLQHIEIHATEEDIRQYINVQIQHSFRLSRHVQTRPELRGEIISKISSNVKGMFLLAKLHIGSLATKSSVKSVREALQHLPKDLTLVYDGIMQRIDSQNEEDRQLAHLTLTWVANVKRPLSVAELQEALAIEPGTTSLDPDNVLDLDIILSVCAGLIIVDNTMSIVRLIHYTTQYYLDGIQENVFPNAQTEIASRCLTYLSFTEFSKLPGYHPDRWELLRRHPFLRYAQHCLIHAHGQPEVVLQTSILEFLKKASHWYHFWSDLIYYELVAPWNYPWPDVSPLWCSASADLQFITSHMVATGVSPINETTKNYAIYGTVYYSHEQMLLLLIEKGFNVNARGRYGTVLHFAVVWRQERMVQLLLQHGADVNRQGGEYGTVLQAASYKGYEEIVEILLEHGADLDAQGGSYGTALQAASDKGYKRIVQMLLDNGADVSVEVGKHSTALQAASYKGYTKIVEMLLKNGADANTRGGEYGTLLQAVSYKGYKEIVTMVLDNGADVNAQGGKYGTALQAASYMGCKDVVKILLEKGADVNSQGGEYGTALQAASYAGSKTVVQILLDNSGDVNAQGGTYGTPLKAACYRGYEEIVHLLLENGADVHARGGDCGTALNAASEGGSQQIFRILIENGADNNALSNIAECFSVE